MFSSPKEIFEGKIPTKLKGDPSIAKSINAKVAFVLSGDQGGNWVLDCTQTPGNVVKGEAADAKATVTMGAEDFVKLANGDLKPEMAFLTGKLKVKGDMSLAIKLGKVLT